MSCRRARHAEPLEFLHLRRQWRPSAYMRTAINVESRDEPRLFVRGSASEGPGDHSPRLQWVCGDHPLEALKGATQLLLEASDHLTRLTAPPTLTGGGRELGVSPFQGSSCSISFPTAEAVGYDLWPLRGLDDRRCRPLRSQGCYLANVETHRGTPCHAGGLGMPSPYIAGSHNTAVCEFLGSLNG